MVGFVVGGKRGIPSPKAKSTVILKALTTKDTKVQ
jgi:hypothetical protein